MPTIEKRVNAAGKVTWRARVRLKGEMPIGKTFDRKTDADAWAREIETRADQGFAIPSRPEAMRTVGDAIDRWVRDRLPELAQSDQQNAGAIAARWRLEVGALTLARLTPDVVETTARKLRDEIGADGKLLRSPQRVNRFLATLSRVLGYARKNLRWIDKNPCASVSRYKEPRGRVRFFTPDEVSTLLAAVDARTDRHGTPRTDFAMFVRIALFTGARRGEVAGLQWRDLDLTLGRITFRATKNDENRTVPTPAVLTSLLREYAKVRPLDGTARLFAHDFEYDWRHVRHALPDLKFHDTRHNVASQMAMSGASLLDIAEITGHKSLAMVQRYSHLSDDHVRAKMEQAAARIAPKASGK